MLAGKKYAPSSNTFRVACDAGFLPAHDTTDSDGALASAMTRFSGVSEYLLPSSASNFSLARQPDLDAAVQFFGVERVRRLAELEHHEIGDIDDTVDRANPDSFQFRAQPIRTGRRLDLFDPARRIKWALAGALI